MLRVNEAVKSKAGKAIKCGRCGKKIEPGKKYFSFAFFRSAKQFRCADHRPRQSELTQTPMGQAYAAIESVEDTITNAHAGKADVSDIASALHDAASEVESTKEEYEGQKDNLPENFQNGQQGEEIDEKVEGLDSFHDTLEDAANEVESLESEEEEKTEETTEGEEEKEEEDSTLDKAIELAENALGEFSL